MTPCAKTYEIGCTMLPATGNVMPSWIATESNVTPATYQSSKVRRRTRSTKKKISAETASIASGVMMYIHGTYWTPYRLTKSASAPSLPIQSAPTMSVNRP